MCHHRRYTHTCPRCSAPPARLRSAPAHGLPRGGHYARPSVRNTMKGPAPGRVLRACATAPDSLPGRAPAPRPLGCSSARLRTGGHGHAGTPLGGGWYARPAWPCLRMAQRAATCIAARSCIRSRSSVGVSRVSWTDQAPLSVPLTLSSFTPPRCCAMLSWWTWIQQGGSQ